MQVNDDQQPEDIYEDDDDENSENNWRNEYPEEENTDEDEESRGTWVAALDGRGLLRSKTEVCAVNMYIFTGFPSLPLNSQQLNHKPLEL